MRTGTDSRWILKRVESRIALDLEWKGDFVAEAELLTPGDLMRGNSATYEAAERDLVFIVGHSHVHDSYAIVIRGRILRTSSICNALNPARDGSFAYSCSCSRRCWR